MRRLSVFIWSIGIFVGIMASGTAAWCQASAHGNSSPDVYLITIDTLRADHVGCYGYKQVETPALDALAADGIRFTQASLIARSLIPRTLRSSPACCPACTGSLILEFRFRRSM